MSERTETRWVYKPGNKNRYEWIDCLDCNEHVLVKAGGTGRCLPCAARKAGGWKGEDVTYSELHNWVARHRGRPSLCEHCGTTEGLFDWANISGEYRRDLADFMRLCKSCHIRHDAAIRGERTGRRVNHAKLNADIVREVRRRHAAGERQAALAREYGVTPAAIGLVISRKNWGWVV